MRSQIAWLARLCRSCVVRTISSARAFSASPIASNCAAVRSASANGVSPSRAAVCSILRPCSSHAGDEQHVAAVEPHESGDRVRRDALIGVADMRRAIGVGDRGGDVETLALGHAGIVLESPFLEIALGARTSKGGARRRKFPQIPTGHAISCRGCRSRPHALRRESCPITRQSTQDSRPPPRRARAASQS